MRKIRDIDEYYDDEFEDEYKKNPRPFKKEHPDLERKRKWDREDSYRRPSDFDEY